MEDDYSQMLTQTFSNLISEDGMEDEELCVREVEENEANEENRQTQTQRKTMGNANSNLEQEKSSDDEETIISEDEEVEEVRKMNQSSKRPAKNDNVEPKPYKRMRTIRATCRNCGCTCAGMSNSSPEKKILNDLLMEAIKNGDLALTKMIVQKCGVDFLPSWASGNKLIKEAISHKQVELVKYFYEDGVEYDEDIVQSILNLGRKDLVFAVLLREKKDLTEDYLAMFKNLVMEGSRKIESGNVCDDLTMFKVAMYNGCKEMLGILLEFGADINIRDSAGKTLLMTAVCDARYVDLIPYLLEKGIDVNAESANRKTAMDYFLDSQEPDANIKILKHLLSSSKLDLKRVDSQQRTPLSRAISQGNIKVMETLIEHGVSVNSLLPNGLTPLQSAVSQQTSPKIIKHLMELGADVAAVDAEKNTTMDYFFKLRDPDSNLETFKVLLDHDESLEMRDRSGRTPLERAVSQDNLGVISLLVERGLSINQNYYSQNY